MNTLSDYLNYKKEDWNAKLTGKSLQCYVSKITAWFVIYFVLFVSFNEDSKFCLVTDYCHFKGLKNVTKSNFCTFSKAKGKEFKEHVNRHIH